MLPYKRIGSDFIPVDKIRNELILVLIVKVLIVKSCVSISCLFYALQPCTSGPDGTIHVAALKHYNFKWAVLGVCR